MTHPISRITAVLAGTLVAACMGQAAETRGESPPAMSNPTRENKQIVRRLFEDGMNQGNVAAIDELIAAEYADPVGGRGPQAFKDVMVRLKTAFPDLKYTVDELLGEGDQVAIRWHWTGTHQGNFRGLAPTQRSVTNTGNAIFHLRAGKIVAASLETDRLGFLQGIGVVPANEVLFAPRSGRSGEP
jgi:predicted ester cyclase